MPRVGHRLSSRFIGPDIGEEFSHFRFIGSGECDQIRIGELAGNVIRHRLDQFSRISGACDLLDPGGPCDEDSPEIGLGTG